MRDSGTRPLVFLATCLAFAETALGTLAGLTDANATMVAAFAMGSLGMVLLALVSMYFREPAFLTFTGQQALDLRMLQSIVDRGSPELIKQYLDTLIDQGISDVSHGHSGRIANREETEVLDMDELLRELDSPGDHQDRGEG